MRNLFKIILIAMVFTKSYSQSSFLKELYTFAEEECYRTVDTPYIEIVNDDTQYTIFWFKQTYNYIVFMENETVRFIVNSCKFPASRVKGLGKISMLNKKKYGLIDFSTSTIRMQSSKNDLNKEINFNCEKDIFINKYSNQKNLNLDEVRKMAVIIELEIPILFYIIDDILFEQPLDY